MYDPLDTAVGSFKSQVDKTKGYMSRVESQRIYPLNILFEPADLDGDGKLYEEELSQFVDETRKQTGQSATVAVTNRGERLFSCLDRNADGLVDPREQQAIPETLQKYDTNLDDQIQRHELPTNYDIVFRKGQIKLLEQAIGVVDQLQSASPPLPVDAPKWFRLLDRNRDGIVERVEYPGRGAEFKKLDANGDGDVSIAEAKEAAAPK
jgi:Ca2+-binding EF-hand superfamily protein